MKFEKPKMMSSDLTTINIGIIQKFFPNVIVETRDESGDIKLSVDFNALKQELSNELVDEKQERYQMTWPDKKKYMLLANKGIIATLRPDVKKSVNFNTTKNIYIEGDNLDVLKLIRETYLEKIKIIYIDPPYNTGSDFIYEDDFSQSENTYLNNSGQYDESGNRLTQNNETNGRFHTDWLNMMYPRLKVAKDLLNEDGIIFMSIDDSEVKNAKSLFDEIFGEKNFIAQLIWQNKKGGGNDSKHIAIEHEYILCYAKNITTLHEFYEKYSDDYLKRYKEEDENGRFFWDTFKRKAGKQYYPITCPDGSILEFDEDGNRISWLRSEARFKSDLEAGEIRFVKNGKEWSVQFKQRMPVGKTPRSIFTTDSTISDKGTTSSGSSDVYSLFGKDVFSNPKPVDLIDFLVSFSSGNNDIVLDFFSGSGTTAEAVFRENYKDGCNRTFILVQLPEMIVEKGTSANNANVISRNAIEVLEGLGMEHKITELAEERIRRAGKKVINEAGILNSNIDIGFRVFKLDSSNMNEVYYNPKAMTQNLLEATVDNIKPDRTPLDLLFQLMLECGALLSSKIEEQKINGKTVFIVEDNYIAACFDDELDNKTIEEIAKLHPVYACFKGSSFDSDSANINAEQIFKTYSPNTEKVKVI